MCSVLYVFGVLFACRMARFGVAVLSFENLL